MAVKAALALLLLPALLAGCLGGGPDGPRVADVPTGQIDGAVVDHLLRPFANHTVSLLQLDRTTATTPRGGFTFQDVPVGFYTVSTGQADWVSAAQVVEVKPGEVTRVILQLLPGLSSLGHLATFAFSSEAEQPEAGAVCQACAWSIDLPAERPDRIRLEADWAPGILLGATRDHLDFRIVDDRGFELLAVRDVATPAFLSFDGVDLHPESRRLDVEVRFGRDYLPSTGFTMDSILTLYYEPKVMSAADA